MKHLITLLAIAASCATAAKPPLESPHYEGGMDGIVRARWTVIPTTKDAKKRDAIAVPKANMVYVVPLRRLLWSESQFWAYHPEDDSIEFLEAGTYRATFTLDWVAQDNSDCYSRKIMINKQVPGTNLGARWDTRDNSTLLNVHDQADTYWKIAWDDIFGICAVNFDGTVSKGSADGGRIIHTADEVFLPGDRIFATLRSDAPGAMFQTTNMTWFQIARIRTPAVVQAGR
jgi:hypothetical protein